MGDAIRWWGNLAGVPSGSGSADCRVGTGQRRQPTSAQVSNLVPPPSSRCASPKRSGSALKVGPGGGGNACYDVAEKQFLEEKKHGSAGLAGNGVYLFPRVGPLRSEKNAGVGSHRGKSTDRVPPRIERTQVHVRSRNEKPGTGDGVV